MKFDFDLQEPVVYISALVSGPKALVLARLIVDTGATHTCLSPLVLTAAGFDLTKMPQDFTLFTGNGPIQVAQVRLQRLFVMEQMREDFPVFAQSLPPSSKANGVLGLDFLRGLKLTLDFRLGEIELV